MKTNKLIVITEGHAYTISLAKVLDYPKEKFIDLLQRGTIFADQKIVDIADANTNHICKYCGEIAEGTDEDVLCANCRMTFGHAFYSEL